MKMFTEYGECIYYTKGEYFLREGDKSFYIGFIQCEWFAITMYNRLLDFYCKTPMERYVILLERIRNSDSFLQFGSRLKRNYFNQGNNILLSGQIQFFCFYCFRNFSFILGEYFFETPCIGNIYNITNS